MEAKPVNHLAARFFLDPLFSLIAGHLGAGSEALHPAWGRGSTGLDPFALARPSPGRRRPRSPSVGHLVPSQDSSFHPGPKHSAVDFLKEASKSTPSLTPQSLIGAETQQ